MPIAGWHIGATALLLKLWDVNVFNSYNRSIVWLVSVGMNEMLQSLDLELTIAVQSPVETKTKILKLEAYEQRYKYYCSHINFALAHPNEVDFEAAAEMVDCEELELDKIDKICNILNSHDQRPYIKLLEHYRKNVDEHRLLLELLEEDEQKYLERVRQSKQIDQTMLEEYLESQSLKHHAVGIMALLGAFIIDLIIGASYRWNMINIYITSYYKVTVEPELLVTEDSIASPLSLFCMGVGMRAGVRLAQGIGVFPTLLLSMLLTTVVVYVSSYMPNFESNVLFGFSLYPFLSCLSFQLIISQCCNYYRKYRLVITGFLLIGTGLGHVLFGLINIQCCNPSDLAVKDGYYGGNLDFVARRVPQCLRSMSAVVLLAGLVGVMLMLPAIGHNSQKKIENEKKRKVVDFEYTCASEKEALGSLIFWVMIAMIICSTSGNYFLITNYKNLCAKYNSNSLSLASVMLGFNLGNAFSRALWDFLFPKIGFKWCLVIINSINALNLGTIQLILQDNSLYSLYFVLGGVCLGGCMLCFLNFATIVFGQHVGEQLPGYIWTAYSLASLLQYVVFNSYDLHRRGYLPSCLVLCCLNLISLGLLVRVRLQGNWQNSLHLLELKCCFS